MTEQEAALLLSMTPDTKPATLLAIARTFGGFAAYLAAAPGDLPPELADPARYCFRHRARLEKALAETMKLLESGDLQAVPVTADAYPVLLKEIHSPPVLLYVRGNADVLSYPQLAIVGSRRASRWGLNQAERFADALAASGMTVTSGLALGVDGAAHRGALRSGSTVAVLGCGADVLYPRQHRRLYDAIVDGGGAVVSELPPGSPPLRGHFPRRNRIISGLAMGVLVVEAAARSGSLITARMAMEQGREVFAIPGAIHNPLSRGCHRLIREGAVLTESLDDIVDHLGGFLSLKAEEAGFSPPDDGALSAVGRSILQAMNQGPVEVDVLQQLVAVDIAELTGALTHLEIDGWVENVGGRYQRVR